MRAGEIFKESPNSSDIIDSRLNVVPTLAKPDPRVQPQSASRRARVPRPDRRLGSRVRASLHPSVLRGDHPLFEETGVRPRGTRKRGARGDAEAPQIDD